jgi:hypothetical protein
MLDSQLADSLSNYFEVVVGIARLDQDVAKKLFDRASDEVGLHEPGSYFAALAALYPDRIWDEFQALPKEPDARGITYQPYVRNALIPALCAESDEEFWTELSNNSHLRIPALNPPHNQKKSK